MLLNIAIKLRKIINWVIVAALIGSVIVCCDEVENDRKTRYLVIAVGSDYYPFEYFDEKTQHIVGFDVDLAKEIGNIMNCNIIFKYMPFSKIINSVKNGEVDIGISAISPDSDRTKLVDFSVPYYVSSFVLMFKNSNPIYSLTELDGKLIGIEGGTSMERYLSDYSRRNEIKININTYTNTTAAIAALHSNEVAAIMIEELPALKEIILDKHKQYALQKVPETSGSYAIALQKQSKFTDEINSAIIKLINNGRIMSLYEKYDLIYRKDKF